jgi:peptidoglycan hydrolase-like protein with peptidoglycan-binding domain
VERQPLGGSSRARQPALARDESRTEQTPPAPSIFDAGNHAVAGLLQRQDAATASPAAGTRPTLRQGALGENVRTLQTELNASEPKPDPPLDVDGGFGPKTRAAVIAFQTAHGLEPDGAVGPLTWAALDEASAAGDGGPLLKPKPGETPEEPQGDGPEVLTRDGDDVISDLPNILPNVFGSPGPAGPVGKPKPGQTVPIASPGGAFRGDVLDAANNVLQSNIVLNPAGKQAHDVFGTDLGVPGEAVAGADSAQALGRVLGVPDAALPFIDAKLLPNAPGLGTVVPGSLSSLIANLSLVVVGVAAAQLQGVVTAEQLQQVTARVIALQTFYTHQLNALDRNTTNSKRQQVVSIALAQIGAVNDRKPDGEDTADPRAAEFGGNRKFRIGHDLLNEFFRTSLGHEGGRTGGKKGGPLAQGYDPDAVHHITPRRDPASDIQDWCAMFLVWVYRSAGLTIGSFKLGSGFSSVGGLHPVAKKDVKPGDTGVIDENAHHFMVVEVQGDNLVTIEGNTGLTNKTRGGEIAEHQSERKLSTTNGFFSPDDLP